MTDCQSKALMFASSLLFGFILGAATLVNYVRAADEENTPTDMPPTAPQQGKGQAEAAAKLKAAASTEQAVQRGLTWLASQQSRDGSWSATGG